MHVREQAVCCCEQIGDDSSHAEQRVEETVTPSRPPPPATREAITGLLSLKLRDAGRPVNDINGKGCTWASPLLECRHNASESKSNEFAG